MTAPGSTAAALVEIVLMPGREDRSQENNDELTPPPYEYATRYEMHIRSR